MEIRHPKYEFSNMCTKAEKLNLVENQTNRFLNSSSRSVVWDPIGLSNLRKFEDFSDPEFHSHSLQEPREILDIE